MRIKSSFPLFSPLYLLPVAGVCLLPGLAFADNASTDPSVNLTQVEQELQQQQQQLSDAQQKLGDQLKRLKQQEQALKRQQAQINALKSTLATRQPASVAAAQAVPTVSNAAFTVPPAVAPSSSVRVMPAAQTEQTPSQTAPVTQTQPEERPQIADVSLASQGGVLTPKGVFSFEPTYQYQYASNNQVLISGLTIVPGITIGSTSVHQLVDRMQTLTLGGRLGVTNRLEVEAEFPFVYRSDTTTVTPFSTSTSQTSINASGKDIGDIQFGAHYQLNNGADGWPYFVANMLVKSDTGRSPFDVPVDFNTGVPTEMNTGTGFWAVQPSLTAIYPSDPVVFFANLRYIWNVARTVTVQPTANTTSTPQRENIDPGDGIGGTFGMGFGINDRASFSLAYEHTYLMSTSQNGATIPGSTYDIGAFDLGFAYQLSQRTSINLGVSIGATKAAPDTSITLRIPVKFQVFH